MVQGTEASGGRRPDATGGGNLGLRTEITLLGTPEDGDTSVEYLVRHHHAFDGNSRCLPLTPKGWGIKDPDNVLGGGGTINVTVTTRAANTGQRSIQVRRLRRVVERSCRCDRY